METPDVILVVSHDGWKELLANGILARCRAETLILLDSDVAVSAPMGRTLRLPLRQEATPQRAALAGLAAWVSMTTHLPAGAWDAVLATLPAERRADAAEALQIGRRLAVDGSAAVA